MNSAVYGFAHFIQWCLELLVAVKLIPVIIGVAIIVFGMAFWLRTQVVLSRKAKEKNEFI